MLFVAIGDTAVFKTEKENFREGSKVLEFTDAEWSNIILVMNIISTKLLPDKI
jgi:hypothetical protein